MNRNRSFPSLDHFRMAAALLVAAIHTSPLGSWNETADFLLTRVLARIAVPFFLMVSGYFLAQSGWRKDTVKKFLLKTSWLYLVSIFLYFPLNLYAGLPSVGEAVKRIFLEGTFYHLWYFPAVLTGCVIAYGLNRIGLRAALPIAAFLYFIGLGGDSYYGIAAAFAPVQVVYKGIFCLFSYTRNGIFFTPLFLLLGTAAHKWNPKEPIAFAGFLLSLGAMGIEGLILRHIGVQRHDSMYLFLPICMMFLFSFLLIRNNGENKTARSISMLVYLLHPWMIVLVRAGAKIIGMEHLFIQNQFVHFLAVSILSVGVSGVLTSFRRCSRTNPTARAWREIDLKALQHNVRILKEQIGPGCELMAVLKADAYGHGAVLTARSLQKQGIVKAFAVACLTEAIQLRKAGIRGMILILGYTLPSECFLLSKWGITQTVVDEAYAVQLSEAARGRKIQVHLAMDTGMNRLGTPSTDLNAFRRIFKLPNLEIQGVFSHLCVSDSLLPEDVAFTLEQINRFYSSVLKLQADGLKTGRIHFQASYGVVNLPAQPCDFARIGIALYGVYSHNASVQRKLDIWPVLSLKTRVVLVKNLKPGETAGYGRAFCAKRNMKLAVLSFGYADGLPRDFSGMNGMVLLHGKRAPVVGRLCMDQMLADVTDIDDVKGGDVATILGRDGAALIRAEDLAEQCGMITNEFLCRLGARLPYKKI